MTPAIQHYQSIRDLRSEKDDPKFVTVNEGVPNDYGENSPDVPAGAVVLVDFGFGKGLYGRFSTADSMTTTVCRIDADHFHKLSIVNE